MSSLLSSLMGFNLKGSIGEFATSLALKFGANENLKIVRNIFVPTTNGKTTEIDIVIIHSTGIYAIECKNYSGWIFGSIDNKNWTQSFSNGKKYQFYNPVLQNKYHIYALSKYLNVPEKYFKSYIVFGEECELKKVPSNTDKLSIMKFHSLSEAINNDLSHRDHIFSDSVVSMYSSKISELIDTTGQTKKAHVEQIKRDHPEKQKEEEQSLLEAIFSGLF